MSNSKLIAGLVIGLLIGAAGTYIFLFSQVNDLNNEISSLIEANIQLTTEIQTISDELDVVLQNTDLQDQIEDLQQTISDNQGLIDEYNELELQLLDSEVKYDDLFVDLQSLNENYQQLLSSYKELQKDYDMINGPTSKFASINDLDIEVTTDRTVYNYTDSVKGTLSIQYKDGSPFTGRVTFTVREGGSTTGWTQNINNGYLEYMLNQPVFSYGPDQYTIGPSYIRTSDGFIVADPNDLENMVVQIEAK